MIGPVLRRQLAGIYIGLGMQKMIIKLLGKFGTYFIAVCECLLNIHTHTHTQRERESERDRYIYIYIYIYIYKYIYIYAGGQADQKRESIEYSDYTLN